MRPLFLVAAATSGMFVPLTALAQTSELTPAGGIRHRTPSVLSVPVGPPLATPTNCPPGTIPAPIVPYDPTRPDANSLPAVPTVPDASGAPSLTTPVPTTAPAPGELPATPASALAEASQGGGSGGRTALPQVFGDLPGGGAIAGPLPVRRAANGQFIGPAPTIIRNGQRTPAGPSALPPTPFVDESLAVRTPANTITPQALASATLQGYTPPPGAVIAPEFAEQVSLIPQVVRGAFKITENESPRPTTRAYLTYNFYDQIFRNAGGPEVPRVVLHQQTFGYEQAFGEGDFSVGIRLPYNQLVSPGFVNFTGLGDLSLIGKVLLLEKLETGDLLSAGLVVTVPSGSDPFPSTLTGRSIRGTLIQPYLGYIYSGGSDFFVQGFSSITVPTDTNDVTLMSNDMAIGYRLYENEQGRIQSIIPVLELHLNTPLDQRDRSPFGVNFPDTFSVLGGLHTMLRSGLSIGFAAGAPITGPRPFSLQSTLQVNYRF